MTTRVASEYLNQLFGLTGQTAVVIGGTGVLGGAFCEAHILTLVGLDV